MGAGALVGQMLDQVHRLGYRRVAAAAANRLYKDRSFEIDRDGHWINRQADCTFASPTPFAQRYDYVRDKIVDEWLFDYRLQHGDVVFDVGAGIGEEAVIFADMAGPVYAIEAHPDTFACLRKTISLSGRDNVIPLQLALSDSDGELSISSGEAHIANSVMTGTASGYKVPARSLASICREFGLDRIDFLKMNIEGAERLAIRGFGDVHIDHLVISCHDFTGDPALRTKAEVGAFLRERGYEVRERPEDPRPWTRFNLYARRH